MARHAAHAWSITLPKLPRLLHEAMTRDPMQKIEQGFLLLIAEQRQRNCWLMAIAALLAALSVSLWFLAAKML